MISGTNLTEERKVATSASIDKCLAKNSTVPYDYFQFDQELIQGSLSSSPFSCLRISVSKPYGCTVFRF